MALSFSSYVDPGVYIQEVITPGALNLQTLPVLPTLVANGSKLKRIVNEDIIRGLVASETLTVASSSPHTATLANRGDRKAANTTVFADGVALRGSLVSYPAATLTGTSTGSVGPNFDLSTNNAFVLQIDKGSQVTMTFAAGSAGVSISGTQIDVTTPMASGIADCLASELAAGINAGLAAASALGYGSAYNSTASVSTNFIQLTSDVAGVNSNITVSSAIAADAVTEIFGTARQSATVIRIADAAYDANVTAYTINYVDLDDVADIAAQTTATQKFLKVGSYPGVGTYTENTDFAVPSNGVINWSTALTNGSITSLDGSSGFNLGATDVLQLSLDGKAAIDIDLHGLASPPLGYDSSGVATSVSLAKVRDNINAVLANSTTYGPFYQAAAAVSGNTVVITSPTAGSAGSVSLTHPAANSAGTLVFGLALSTAALTSSNQSGARPAVGSTYFASYDYTRPAADYNSPKQFFTLGQALAFTGPLAADNPLAIAAFLTFKNGAPSAMLCQVNDNVAGSPTPVEFQAALDAIATRSVATDIVVLDTNIDTHARLKQHIEDMSGPLEQNYRRGYFGMPTGTAIGDLDTADTYVFKAGRTLQVAADSAARGRLMLLASPGPEGIKADLLLEDGTTATVTLDSSYIGCAVAGRLAGFQSPSDALVRQELAGFRANEDDFTPWVRSERAALAGGGVTVLTFDAGRFILLDPVSTERAGGGLIAFEQWSSSLQKDNIVRKVRTALDANIVGIVPLDVNDFILDIKQFIASVLVGEIGDGAIGPYTDDSGNRRALDLNQDILVQISPTDPTQYNFSFFFNLRYPALRLYGEYSVDNPFFSQTA